MRTVLLIRSKGVSIVFITQSPTDVPDEVLAQLGSRVQHLSKKESLYKLLSGCKDTKPL